MSTSQSQPEKNAIHAGAAFGYRDFRLYQVARALVITGAEAQSVAVAWQVYQITHRALDLGYTGLALFLPGLLFILPSGHVADRFDRRRVVMICYALQVLCSAALFFFAYSGMHRVLPIYIVLFLVGSGRSFSGPASTALVPHLVPPEHFVNAVTWGATVFQFANIIGPAVGGLLFTLPMAAMGAPRLAGSPIVFLFTIVSLIGFVSIVSRLDVRPGRMENKATSVATVLAGFRYVWKARMLLGSISLDLFVVLLGGAVALMPIFADTVLHTGARGLGLLRAAPSLGALAVSVWLSFHPIQRKAGRLMFLCVGIFGAATVIFGLSRNIVLTLCALVAIGASDMVSVVVRSSLLQLATPPEMRGRVSAVNSLFLGASNEFGEFESGLTAQWLGPVRAVVLGGIGALMVTGIWAMLFPSLRKADRLSADALMSAELVEATQEPID